MGTTFHHAHEERLQIVNEIDVATTTTQVGKWPRVVSLELLVGIEMRRIYID